MPPVVLYFMKREHMFERRNDMKIAQEMDLYQKLDDIGIDFSKINGDGLIDKIAKYAKIIWHRIFG